MSLASVLEHLKETKDQYNSKFWVVNTLELFERGAYYGTMAILAVHFHDNLGYSASLYGTLAMVLMFLLYFVPLVAAALAKKIGYRTTLIGAFILMLIGYTSLGLFTDLGLVIFAILMLGVGAGAFKPMVSATIAHVTPSDQRNAGYSIYYWMINLGAFLVPLCIGLTGVLNLMNPEKDSHIVFFISTGLISINLLFTLLHFEDPVEPDSSIDVTAAMKTLWEVIHDRNFVIILAIYSGFWFMFAMNHSYLPLYMLHFLDMPDWFSVFFLASINPGVIILVGFELSKVVEKYDSLQLMMCGITMFVIGLLLVGLTTIPALFFLGIIIFSLGEFITHPNFIAYVSKIAPKDKVAVYMGYVFIPTGVGYSIGSFVGGLLFEHVAKGMEWPKLFWAIVCSAGLLTVIGFVFYDLYIVRKGDFGASAVPSAATVEEPTEGEGSIVTADFVEDEEMEYEEEEEEEERKPSPIPYRLPPSIAKSSIGPIFPALAAAFFIVIILSAAVLGGKDPYHENDDGEYIYYEKDWETWETFPGHTEEGDETNLTEEFEEDGIAWFKFTLTWEDEADASNNHHNDPDEFEFTVHAPWGRSYTSKAVANDDNSKKGEIILELEITEDMVEGSRKDTWKTSGDFSFLISCNEAGDQIYSGFDPREGDENDTGNDWEFQVDYQKWGRYEKGDTQPKV